MIKVKYTLVDDNYTQLDIKGHSGSAEAGVDLICAAASSIMFGLMNALDEYKDVDIKESNNHIIITNNSSLDKVNNFIELALIQLKTLEESYSKFIKIERK